MQTCSTNWIDGAIPCTRTAAASAVNSESYDIGPASDAFNNNTQQSYPFQSEEFAIATKAADVSRCAAVNSLVEPNMSASEISIDRLDPSENSE